MQDDALVVRTCSGPQNFAGNEFILYRVLPIFTYCNTQTIPTLNEHRGNRTAPPRPNRGNNQISL